jgi:methyl-accepting chemotaxis protein
MIGIYNYNIRRYTSLMENLTNISKVTIAASESRDILRLLVISADDADSMSQWKINRTLITDLSSKIEKMTSSENASDMESFINSEKNFIQSADLLVKQCISGDFAARETHENTSKLTDYLKENSSVLIQKELNYGTVIQKAVDRQFRITNLLSIGAFVLIIFLSFGLMIYILRKIVRSLINVVHSSKKIASGDLTENQSGLMSEDEIGMLSRSFDSMRESLFNIISMISLNAQNVKNLCEKLDSITNENEIMDKELGSASQGNADSASNQSNLVESTLKSIRFIDESLQKIYSDSDNVMNSAVKALGKAVSGQERIREVMREAEHVHEIIGKLSDNTNVLYDYSVKIGNIVSFINDLSEQTNLLALNAAIEAARAGDSGRGFAVVADEVGKLADQSRQSSSEITGIIKEIRGQIEHMREGMRTGVESISITTKLAAEEGESFGDIIDANENVNRQIESITRELGDARQSMSQITTASTTVAEITKDLASAATEQLAAVETKMSLNQQMSTLAANLKAMAGDFEKTVGNFKLK